MAGYYNYSMSNNAVEAYELGEKPISKWTKAELLKACGEKAEFLKVLTAAELKETLLVCSSWHHTSCKYNRTDFYSIDEEALEEVTPEVVQKIIEARKLREKRGSARKDDEVLEAEIVYTIWVGNYANYKRPKEIKEVVKMKKSDKMVTTSYGNKRVSSLKSVVFLKEVKHD